MTGDSSSPTSQSLGHVRGDTAEHLAGKLSGGKRTTPRPQLEPMGDDGKDKMLLLCSHASPATPLAGYSRLSTSLRCLIVAAFLSGCLLLTYGWCATDLHLPATVYLLEVAAKTRTFVRG
jgi:hypothetical protein